jgi:hypothetical protein
MKLAFCFLIFACLCVSQPGFCSGADSEPPTLSDRSWSSFETPAGTRFAAQTDDGTLWLSGSASSLYRFDGTRFTSYISPVGYKPISRKISALQSWPNGGLWVGSWYGGITAIHGDRLTEYTQRDGLPGGTVFDIFKDPA